MSNNEVNSPNFDIQYSLFLVCYSFSLFLVPCSIFFQSNSFFFCNCIPFPDNHSELSYDFLTEQFSGIYSVPRQALWLPEHIECPLHNTSFETPGQRNGFDPCPNENYFL